MSQHANRYWGDRTPPKAKAEFFNAVTTPAGTGEGKVATIRLYGPIDSWGGWWGISAKELGAVLDALPASVEQIILRINSPGGEVFEGVSMLNMLRAHKASVLAVVDGLAASAASVIAAGADETVMSPGTQMMIHSPWVIMAGDAEALRHEANVLDTIESSLIQIYRDKAGEKNWGQLLAEETWYSAEDAVAEGLADRTAVIPDAGEAETVGAEPLELDDDDSDGDVENLIILRPAARMPARAASKLPVSTEPGDPNRKDEAMAYGDLKAGLRDRLGVTDADPSDETLLAAVDQVLAEQADIPTAIVSTLPEGVVTIEESQLEQLRSDAAAGREARDEQVRQARKALVDDAVRNGKIAPARAEHWEAALAADPGAAEQLNALQPGLIPLEAKGHTGGVDEATDDDPVYSKVYPAPTDTKEA